MSDRRDPPGSEKGAAAGEDVVRGLRHQLRNKLGSIRNGAFYLRRRIQGTELWTSDPRMQQILGLMDEAVADAEKLLLEMGRPPAAEPEPAGPSAILLVDDDEGNRITLSMLLEDEGFTVVPAASFAEAVRSLDTPGARFGLALLDEHLGDGLGSDLVMLVRARFPASKAVMISGSVSAPEPDGGFDSFLPKGTGFPEVLELVRRLLG
jgi:two-component system, response regulator RegA